MLADMIVEEEFEVKEEEPWYSKQQDLEHDLHLAAELGKTLLERNRELEQGLQQMYSTNREQLQEIEYLTKQVDQLRQVNDQHAKVYEQLDVSSRELEQSNRKLSQDNRAAQVKIQGLTETVDGLQNQVEEMQRQLEKLKTSPSQSQKHKELWRPYSTHSVSCLKELQKKHRYSDFDLDDPSDDLRMPPKLSWREEEQASLRRSLRSLQTQLASERAQREASEREADLLASENAALEQQLRMMEGCQARLAELESEAGELRQLWRTESCSDATGRGGPHSTPPDCVFLHSEDAMEEESEEVEEDESPLHYDGECFTDGCQKSDVPDYRLHERSCMRRSETVKYRGISLLNEVDAQYSALQAKYDELLRRCRQGEQDQEDEDAENQSHKAVQTARPRALSLGRAAGTGAEDMEDDFHQPEYKALFKEIFTCIQKTKEDLSENRGKTTADEVAPHLVC